MKEYSACTTILVGKNALQTQERQYKITHLGQKQRRYKLKRKKGRFSVVCISILRQFCVYYMLFIDAADRAAVSEKRRLKRIAERHANKVCFACREMGHAAQMCPNVKISEGTTGKAAVNIAGICYRCATLMYRLSSSYKRFLAPYSDVGLRSTHFHDANSPSTN